MEKSPHAAHNFAYLQSLDHLPPGVAGAPVDPDAPWGAVVAAHRILFPDGGRAIVRLWGMYRIAGGGYCGLDLGSAEISPAGPPGAVLVVDRAGPPRLDDPGPGLAAILADASGFGAGPAEPALRLAA